MFIGLSIKDFVPGLKCNERGLTALPTYGFPRLVP